MKNPLRKENRIKLYDKRPRRYSGYKSVSELDDAHVDWGTAMSQAVVALDHAAHLAKKTKNSHGMREVAIGWLAVAESIGGGGAQPEEDEGEYNDIGDSEENNDVYQIGFRGVVEEEEYEEYDEEDEEEHGSGQSRSWDDVYTTPRGFPQR